MIEQGDFSPGSSGTSDIALRQPTDLSAEVTDIVLWATEELRPHNRGEELRNKFQALYSEHLSHARRAQEPSPNQEADPEGYIEWGRSNDHMKDLSKKQPKVASRVRRLVTPINSGINQRHKRWVATMWEFGEFYDLIPPEKIVKQREILEAIIYYDNRLYEISNEGVYQDVELQMRDEGEAWTEDGTPFYTLGNFEMQAQWKIGEADRNIRIADINKLRNHYIQMLPESVRENLEEHISRLWVLKEEEEEKLRQLDEGAQY